MSAEPNGFQAPFALHDASGRKIGYFVPAAEYEALQRLKAEREAYAWAREQFTDEEIARAKADPREYTLQEVLRHLEKL